jgi:hypothetical protein
MIGKKINQLATELAPESTDLTIIGDPISGVSKKITLAQLGAIFSGAVSFYNDLASFPVSGDINVIYCAKDTQKLYLWSGSAYTEVFPSQALLDTYQLRSEKGNANGYASLDSGGKVPISQLPSSIMEYKGTWNAATNTPTLANGTGDTGDVYICNVAGTVNFGAGAIAFAVGDYVIYSGTIWQRSSGAVGTVTSVAASITGDSVTISGSPVTTSGTLAFAFNGTTAQYIRGNGTLQTFPSLTGFVPYTGATANVDLGTHTLLAAKGIFSSSGSGDTVGITHSSGSGIALNITKGGNGEGLYINKTSGSGNAATIIGTLNATTLVKSGGTSSQFLKADGSVDSTAYGTGSVTSVAALTIGTTGTDLSSTVANSTTTPVITLNVPTASATNRGALSSTDWTTFNNKQNALTNPVTGTGTNNYIPKFTTTGSTIGNSQIFDNGTSVGINIATPLSKLDVRDASAVMGNYQTIQAFSTDSAAINLGGGISLGGFYSGTSLIAQFGSIVGRKENSTSGNYDGYLAFGTNSQATGVRETMRLTSSGNLGLGVTPSAWRTTERALQIGATTSVTDISNFAVFRNNNYVNTSGQEIYITTNGASALVLAPTSEYRFLQAAAGTAGNAITFTQAMTLDASGRLGIGTTNLIAPLTVQSNSGGTGVHIVGRSADGFGFLSFRNNANNTVNGEIGISDAQNMLFYVGATPRLTIASTGAATFSSSVTAGGNINLNNNQGIFLKRADGTLGQGLFIDDSNNLNIGYGTADVIRFATYLNTERMRITSGGNVGIGTNNPQSILHITGPLTFTESGFPTARLNQIVSAHSDGSSPNNNLRFLVSNGSGTTAERMRINGEGALQVTSTIQTGAPANGTAQPWKLGNAVSGTVSPSHYLVVEINGQSYTINAFNGFP